MRKLTEQKDNPDNVCDHEPDIHIHLFNLQTKSFEHFECYLLFRKYDWLFGTDGKIVNFDPSYPVFGDLSFDGGVVVTDGRVRIQQSLSLLHPFHHVFPHHKELNERPTQNITMCWHKLVKAINNQSTCWDWLIEYCFELYQQYFNHLTAVLK